MAFIDTDDNKFFTTPYLRQFNETKYESFLKFINSMKEEADKLMEENDALRKRSNDDIFKEKNKKIAYLKEKLKKANYYGRYSFTPELIDEFDEWWEAHISNPEIQERMKKFKNCGHYPTYEITPSEVGWFYGIKCSCGAHYEKVE